MHNNVSFQPGVSNIGFSGSIHRSARSIFKNLCDDIPSMVNYKDETITSKDVYKKISGYMAKTDKDTELFWKELSILDLFKSDRYEGFMFRNKVTGKEIRGSKYPLLHDFNVIHPSEKYIDELGVTAQAPLLRSRIKVSGYKSPFIEGLHEYSNDYTRYVVDGESYYNKNAPILGFFTGIIRKIIGIFPQKHFTPYGISELHSLNKWVDELTNHTEPRDVDKLLDVIK